MSQGKPTRQLKPWSRYGSCGGTFWLLSLEHLKTFRSHGVFSNKLIVESIIFLLPAHGCHVAGLCLCTNHTQRLELLSLSFSRAIRRFAPATQNALVGSIARPWWPASHNHGKYIRCSVARQWCSVAIGRPCRRSLPIRKPHRTTWTLIFLKKRNTLVYKFYYGMQRAL